MKSAFLALTHGALAALLLAAAPATAHSRACTAAPAPGGMTRTGPEGHAKASSFAPHHSRQRSYGAPIGKPVVSRHVKAKKKPAARAPTAPSS
jgi:hypothetical protein